MPIKASQTNIRTLINIKCCTHILQNIFSKLNKIRGCWNVQKHDISHRQTNVFRFDYIDSYNEIYTFSLIHFIIYLYLSLKAAINYLFKFRLENLLTLYPSVYLSIHP